jgi:hypothetical protein
VADTTLGRHDAVEEHKAHPAVDVEERHAQHDGESPPRRQRPQSSTEVVRRRGPDSAGAGPAAEQDLWGLCSCSCHLPSRPRARPRTQAASTVQPKRVEQKASGMREREAGGIKRGGGHGEDTIGTTRRGQERMLPCRRFATGSAAARIESFAPPARLG